MACEVLLDVVLKAVVHPFPLALANIGQAKVDRYASSSVVFQIQVFDAAKFGVQDAALAVR